LEADPIDPTTATKAVTATRVANPLKRCFIVPSLLRKMI
jgi:hypothetical protein